MRAELRSEARRIKRGRCQKNWKFLGLIALSYRDACEPGTNLGMLNRRFAGSSPYCFWCGELMSNQLRPLGRLGRGAFSDHSFGDDPSPFREELIPLGRRGSVPTPPCEPFFLSFSLDSDASKGRRRRYVPKAIFR